MAELRNTQVFHIFDRLFLLARFSAALVKLIMTPEQIETATAAEAERAQEGQASLNLFLHVEPHAVHLESNVD